MPACSGTLPLVQALLALGNYQARLAGDKDTFAATAQGSLIK